MKYDSIFEAVLEIPIEKVFTEYGFILNKVGSSYNMESPFRKGSSKTSFTISPIKGIFKDWLIPDYCGNSIKFISLLENKTYFEACFDIALKFGIISQNFYNSVIINKRKPRDYIIYEVKYNKIEKVEAKIAEPIILDKVFRIFMENCKLSDTHKEYLLTERSLTEDIISDNMFFTFPNRSILRGFLKQIEEEFGNQDILKDIPGFFKRKADKNFTFQPTKGIGIPIVNEEGLIVGIQIRRDTLKNSDDMRYIWFSSTFAINDPKEESEFGTSSGSPIDVVYPKELKYKGIFITEGKFKAIALANEYNCICLSVQGVSTWRPIEKMLKALPDIVESKYNKKDWVIKALYPGFDSDLCCNINVYKQLRKMTDALRSSICEDILYLFWDMTYGKGIDDLLLEGNKDKLQIVPKDIFDEAYQRVIDKVLELNPEIQEESKITTLISSEQFGVYFKEFFELIKKEG